MKISLLSLFFVSQLINLTVIVDSCYSIRCLRSSNSSVFSEPITVDFPFRVRDRQPESCGRPGFDVYNCDDNSTGPLLQLPDSVSLRVDDISYYSNRVTLSDSDDCLPRKLLSFNLTESPFRSPWTTQHFWVYNCSGDDYNNYYNRDAILEGELDWYDRIECLSGLNYSVISSRSAVVGIDRWNCTFLKVLIVPSPYYFSSSLSTISTIYLSWNGNGSASKFPVVVLVFGLLGGVVAILSCFCFCICLCINDRRTGINNRSTNAVSTTVVATGLDQVTIDSYPIVVVGESGRLIKPEDEICSICLSDYQSLETLKMLPQCLHRFHVDCIDQWLRSKAICPICRTSLTPPPS